MGFDKRSRNLTEQTQRFVVQPINMRVCCSCENREEDSKSVGFGLPPLRIHSDCDGEHCLSRAIWLIFSRRMQLLSQGSRSAIRALVVLASPNTPERITAEELAPRCDVPIAMLRKHMWKLSQAKLVRSTRGKRGGYALLRSPGSINLREIVQIVDTSSISDTCAFGWSKCIDGMVSSPHCPWSNLYESYRSLLEKTTIADLLPQQTKYGEKF
jgi:Rrf2 family protein